MTKVAQAYERAKPIRDTLFKIGQCMEVTEDKAGILWERWIVGKRSVILFATPHWCDVYRPMTDDMSWNGVIAALNLFRDEI